MKVVIAGGANGRNGGSLKFIIEIDSDIELNFGLGQKGGDGENGSNASTGAGGGKDGTGFATNNLINPTRWVSNSQADRSYNNGSLSDYMCK